MKIIFLDIDGVLNGCNTFMKQYLISKLWGIWEIELDPDMMKRLAQIVQATNSKIVLSSAWKFYLKKENGKILPKKIKGEKLIQTLKQYNLEIYDITPNDKKGHRGREIKSWLSDHPEVETFIVLEDEPCALSNIRSYAIITEFWNPSMPGLCDIHVKEAIEKLNGLKVQPKTYQKRK